MGRRPIWTGLLGPSFIWAIKLRPDPIKIEAKVGSAIFPTLSKDKDSFIQTIYIILLQFLTLFKQPITNKYIKFSYMYSFLEKNFSIFNFTKLVRLDLDFKIK